MYADKECELSWVQVLVKNIVTNCEEDIYIVEMTTVSEKFKEVKKRTQIY
jgi:hypothetical protein